MRVVQALARRERAVLVGGAALLALLAWLDLVRRAAPMTAPVPHDLPATVTMWFVMMVAMMLPSALPALLLFHMAQKGALGGRALAGLTVLFGLGYLAVWFGGSVAAALLQAELQRHALLSGHLALAAPLPAAVALVAAGAYQFTPWKRSCLEHCRSPQDFLVLHWRKGPSGALAMGSRHGLYCVGCCWALMALLFVVGIMNLAWIALLAAFVLVEKAVARGPAFSAVAGVALIGWGGYVAFVALAA